MRTVVVDANIFYSNVQRNVFMTLAIEQLFGLRWTKEIEAEWVRNLIANRPKLNPDAVQRTAKRMRIAIPGFEVIGHSSLADKLSATDARDRHVAAAAIACRPSTLVTWNLKDFDKDELQPFEVTVSGPDAFLCEIFDAKSALTFAATLKSFDYVGKSNPNRSWNGYVDIIGSSGSPNSLKNFAERLRAFRPKGVPKDAFESAGVNDPDVGGSEPP